MLRSASLLVVNPNTSLDVTRDIDALARATVGSAAVVRTVTATFGFGYIDSRVAIAVAAHAVLDVVARELAGGYDPDAIVLGCFGDPGIEALAEMTGVPVIGFAKAGLLAAAALPGSFLVATRGEVWHEVIAELAHKAGISGKIAAIVSIGADDDPDAIATFVDQRAREAGASRIVLGGAGLIPLLPHIAAAVTLPVLDPHREALRKALSFADAMPNVPQRRMLPASAISGLSLELSHWLTSCA
jgi:allantoin racemase